MKIRIINSGKQNQILFEFAEEKSKSTWTSPLPSLRNMFRRYSRNPVLLCYYT